MRILALEPYYGGSHRAFLDGWSSRSRHEWTVIGLPAYKWKWRMRHGAITFAKQVEQRCQSGKTWDAIICSDMLNLAEFRGLVDERVARLPAVAYFHENQLTYPVRETNERDFHFAFTNLTTALAAERVWFNSAFHRDSFIAALREFLRRMPDYQPLGAVAHIEAKSSIFPPGIESAAQPAGRRPGPLRILWAARWEHDKNPSEFFAALDQLKTQGVQFRVSVIGEQFRDSPPIFEHARASFAECIDRWGYQESRDQYMAALIDADVFVSTALHEFFGITVVEAIAAGAYPLLPDRLSYPELLDLENHPEFREMFFYDGTSKQLAARLRELAERVMQVPLWRDGLDDCQCVVRRFDWEYQVNEMDDAIQSIAH